MVRLDHFSRFSIADGITNADFPEAKPAQWLKEEQAVALKEFVMAGNGFYSVHKNSHVSLASKTYRDVQGGAYIGPPPLRPFQGRAVKTRPPTTAGVTASGTAIPRSRIARCLLSA